MAQEHPADRHAKPDPVKCVDVAHFASGAVRSSAVGKVQFSQLDSELLIQTSRVLEFGERKYSRGNWRKGIAYNRCVDSLLRHLFAWLGGETNDPETGLPHLGHLGCNLMFLMRYEKDGRTDLDDREYKPLPPVEVHTPTKTEFRKDSETYLHGGDA